MVEERGIKHLLYNKMWVVHSWAENSEKTKTSCFCEEHILTSLDSAIQTQAAEDAVLIHPCVHREEVWHFTPLVMPGNSKWSKSHVWELGDFKHYVCSSLNPVWNFRDCVRNLRRFLIWKVFIDNQPNQGTYLSIWPSRKTLGCLPHLLLLGVVWGVDKQDTCAGGMWSVSQNEQVTQGSPQSQAV